MSLPYNKFHSARIQRQAPAPSEVLNKRVDDDDTGSRLSQAPRMLGDTNALQRCFDASRAPPNIPPKADQTCQNS
jgi:hypothetical protein